MGHCPINCIHSVNAMGGVWHGWYNGVAPNFLKEIDFIPTPTAGCGGAPPCDPPAGLMVLAHHGATHRGI